MHLIIDSLAFMIQLYSLTNILREELNPDLSTEKLEPNISSHKLIHLEI